MRTEIQIARERIEFATKGRAKFWHKRIAEEHLSSCKRFLKFLEDWECPESIFGRGQSEVNPLWKWLNDKKIELRDSIKEYQKVGIK